jgi:DNA polymerase III subunit epsilon
VGRQPKIPTPPAESRIEPPPGAFDLPLAEAPFAFVDLEMTGLDPATDRVCEACIVRTVGRADVAELDSLVLPELGATGNVAIHGLGPEALEGAPSFAALAPRIEALLDGAILVAHAADHDVAFLRAELGRTGRAAHLAGVLDTLSLSRRAFALSSHRLSSLTAHLGISHSRAHRAGDDARATRELFWKVADVLAARTPRDLFHVRVGERHARPEVIEAAIHAVDAGVPVTVRYRPSKKGPQDVAMVLTDVRTDVDPPRVLGYLHPGRGRKELRADRILAILSRPP